MAAGAVCLQHEVVILVIACLHRFKGVSVVGMLQGEDHRALHFPAVHVILQRHFKRHLHGNAPRIGEKRVVQIPGKPVRKLLRKPLHRFMGQAPEHDMGKLFRL